MNQKRKMLKKCKEGISSNPQPPRCLLFSFFQIVYQNLPMSPILNDRKMYQPKKLYTWKSSEQLHRLFVLSASPEIYGVLGKEGNTPTDEGEWITDHPYSEHFQIFFPCANVHPQQKVDTRSTKKNLSDTLSVTVLNFIRFVACS